MDVMDFKTQYDAGRKTLGTTSPTPPPVMLSYLYRAFMPHKSNNEPAALVKYTYGAFPALPARSSAPIVQ